MLSLLLAACLAFAFMAAMPVGALAAPAPGFDATSQLIIGGVVVVEDGEWTGNALPGGVAVASPTQALRANTSLVIDLADADITEIYANNVGDIVVDTAGTNTITRDTRTDGALVVNQGDLTIQGNGMLTVGNYDLFADDFSAILSDQNVIFTGDILLYAENVSTTSGSYAISANRITVGPNPILGAYAESGKGLHYRAGLYLEGTRLFYQGNDPMALPRVPAFSVGRNADGSWYTTSTYVLTEPGYLFPPGPEPAPRPTPDRVSGDSTSSNGWVSGQTYYDGDGMRTGVSIRGGGAWSGQSGGLDFNVANMSPSDFVKAQVDGKELPSSAYTVTAGTTFTLKASYLNTLSSGKHTLTLRFTGAEGSATFTVDQTQGGATTTKPPSNTDYYNPNTGL